MHILALEIDYAHEKAGWINCHLTIDGEPYHLYASQVFPPFLGLLRFVKAVAGQRFPARFYWDEEGVEALFEAAAISEDSHLVHLKIVYDKSDAPWFDADIKRETIIRAFLPPLLDVSQNFLLADERLAEKHWGMPSQIVLYLENAITKGVPLRSDIHSPQHVECLVKGDYDIEYVDGRVFFHIIFEEEQIVSILLFDTHPFWQQAFDFMQNIASGDLPAQCEHLKVDTWNTDPEPPVKFRLLTRLVAELLDTAENFRLKIFTQYQDEPEFLRLDEVVDRRQFTHGFADSFKQFLKRDYQLAPDKDGKTFDLRILSLEKLDQA